MIAPHRHFNRIAWIAVALALTVIVFGAFVRLSNAGLSCPDWPTCFGSWVPRWEYHTLIEYAHRLLGVVSGLLAVALAVVGIVELVRARRGHPSSTPRGAIWMAVALVPLSDELPPPAPEPWRPEEASAGAPTASAPPGAPEPATSGGP